MRCYTGIDLGSTTTKAVVLDEDQRVLGRGITNSRSNYDVACAVAKGEALMDVRFNLFEASLDRRPQVASFKRAILSSLRRNYLREQYSHQLGELEQHCRRNGEQSLARAAGITAAALAGIFDQLFEGLRQRAEEIFGPGSEPRSDFFRDIAGSGYMSLAEELARDAGVDYEYLLGVYDKSIIAVEGHVPEGHLRQVIGQALERTLLEEELSPAARAALQDDIRGVVELKLIEACTVGTGYGRARLPFPKENIRSEILCHGLGAHATFPETRTVLDIGGQDTKAIQVDGEGIVTSFQMNDRCAAGCGRYLGYIADEMNLGLHELGPLAMQGTKSVRINSTCTVFAGAELRDRLAMGQKREDILAGLHRAIMLRAMSLLARSGGVHDEFTFTGGVAKNEAATTALEGLVVENYGERILNISAESIYTGALGAAIFAQRSTRDGAGDAIPSSAGDTVATGGAA